MPRRRKFVFFPRLELLNGVILQMQDYLEGDYRF
nr:MAG TPA: hypothetical protein [Caudoviricetes sp.]DAS91064.1 MAG TPA: hypothetical protein [Caudoviricetes sp.]